MSPLNPAAAGRAVSASAVMRAAPDAAGIAYPCGVVSAFEAAMIGAIGSVVGGVVVGWFTIVAARGQWKRDRADARLDRSRQAAMSIAESIASMEEALVAWSAGQSSLEAMRAAFNAFSRTAAVQSLALTDSALRQRVRRHVELLARVATVAETAPPGARALVMTARRHADAVIEALEAHCNDAALPSYRPLPLDDAEGLIAWQPAGSQAERQDGGASGGGDGRPCSGTGGA